MESKTKCHNCYGGYDIIRAYNGQAVKKRSPSPFHKTLLISFFMIALLSACGKQGEDEFKAGMLSFKAEDYKPALKQFIVAAEKGHTDAEYMLGKCYFFGLGVTPDKTEAFEYFRKAAEQNNANAQYMLGVCYESGTGIDRDNAESVRLYQLAVKSFQKNAEKGDAEAQLLLGHCYEFGKGTEEDIVKAYKLYSKAADGGNVDAKKIMRAINSGKDMLQEALQGNARAQYMLGNLYQRGEGVIKDDSTAVKWYRKAAEQGNHEAQYMLGTLYQRGEGVIKDDSTAAMWYRKAADQGNREAQYSLGGCYFEGRGVSQDYDEATKWYQKAVDQGNENAGKYIDAIKTIKAAKQGDAYSQFKLGGLYLAGDVMAQNNNEAVNWYMKAAEQGNENAQFELGSLYYGKGGILKKDMDKAIDWWRKAANLGHAKAQFNIGACYYNGNGVEKDLTEAVKWFRKAADQGYMDAQYNLGIIYYLGGGQDEDIEEDIVESTKWYMKAAAQGKEEATDFLASISMDNKLLSDAVQGNADAQFMIAESLRQNLKWDKSTEDTRKNSLMFKWYKKAAEQGNWKAQYNLGVCYYKRYDLIFFDHEDEFSDESIKWFSKAAEQGHTKAQCILGYVYYYGRNYSYGTEIKANIEKDRTKALTWFQKAADQGDETARYNLEVFSNNGKIKKPIIEWNELKEIGEKVNLEEIGKTKNANKNHIGDELQEENDRQKAEAEQHALEQEKKKQKENSDEDSDGFTYAQETEAGTNPRDSRSHPKYITQVYISSISRQVFSGLELVSLENRGGKGTWEASFNVIRNNRKRTEVVRINDTFNHNNTSFSVVDIEDTQTGHIIDGRYRSIYVVYIKRDGRQERIPCHINEPIYDPILRVNFVNALNNREFSASVGSSFKVGNTKTGEEQYKVVSADLNRKEAVVESTDKNKKRYNLNAIKPKKEEESVINESSNPETSTGRVLTDAERARLRAQEMEINRRTEQMIRDMDRKNDANRRDYLQYIQNGL